MFKAPHDLTAAERIRVARRAQLVAHYEDEGWPLQLVQLLNRHPLVTLAEALDGFSVPARAVA